MHEPSVVDMRMSYQSKNLSALAYANGFTLWRYRHDSDELMPPNFFDPASRMLRVGDFIMLNTPGSAGVLVVTRAQSHGSTEFVVLSYVAIPPA